MTRNLDVPDEYAALYRVYEDAYEQASEGKGKERHAEAGEPYEKQIICEVARRVGLGYPLGQAVKKIYESQRLGGDAGVQELLGAMNYLAAAVIVMQERMEEEGRRFREGFANSKTEDGCYQNGNSSPEFKPGEHVQYRIAELSEGARWLDAWYLERHTNGRGHIVKSKAEGRIAVDPDKIRKAPKAEGREEPKLKYGERVDALLPGIGWCKATYLRELKDGEHQVLLNDGHTYDAKICHHAPKAEGCESLVEKDAPQTPQELYQHIVDCNPGVYPRKPTGEELAEMAEEEEKHG